MYDLFVLILFKVQVVLKGDFLFTVLDWGNLLNWGFWGFLGIEM